MAERDARAALQRLIEERGEDYAGLSRLLGRNPAYVQQYIKRGSPKRLAEDDRRLLARYFGVDETLLGGPAGEPGAGPAAGAAARCRRVGGRRGVRRRRARRGPYRLRSRLAEAGRARRAGPAFDHPRRGDSMAPTLGDGDDILVDRGDGPERVRDGVYVLRIDDALVVKRLAVNPAARTLTIRSDNPAYPGWPDCDPAAVEIVGRVVWAGRRIG